MHYALILILYMNGHFYRESSGFRKFPGRSLSATQLNPVASRSIAKCARETCWLACNAS